MSDLNEILTQQPKPKKDLGRLKRLVMALGSVLLVIAAGGVIAFIVIKQNPEIIGITKSEEALSQTPQEELNQTIEAVGNLMLLPNEIPTLATVTELEKLSGQEFFENAREGDKVLIYTEAHKAILYRPDDDKIIEVGTVTVEDVSDQEVEPTTPPGQRPTGPEATEVPFNLVSPTVTPVPSPTPEAESQTENVLITPEPTATP